MVCAVLVQFHPGSEGGQAREKYEKLPFTQQFDPTVLNWKNLQSAFKLVINSFLVGQKFLSEHVLTKDVKSTW